MNPTMGAWRYTGGQNCKARTRDLLYSLVSPLEAVQDQPHDMSNVGKAGQVGAPLVVTPGFQQYTRREMEKLQTIRAILRVPRSASPSAMILFGDVGHKTGERHCIDLSTACAPGVVLPQSRVRFVAWVHIILAFDYTRQSFGCRVLQKG